METLTCRQMGGAAMKGRWKRPVSGLKRYRQVQRDVAARPERIGV